MMWRKSTYTSTSGTTDCVEVADLGADLIGVRDSKAPAAGRLAVGREAFAELVAKVRAGELDLR
jgi:hydroxymethylglutaryl-CoA reductase